MFFSVSRLEHGEKCHLMKVVKKLPTSPQNRDRPALPYFLYDFFIVFTFFKPYISPVRHFHLESEIFIARFY